MFQALCLLLITLWPVKMFAQGFVMRSSVEQTDITPYTEYYIDSKSQLKMEEVLQKSEGWLPGSANKLSFGFSPHTFWVRIRIANSESATQSLVLDVDHPLLDHLQLYLLNADGSLLKEMKTGDVYPFRQRPIIHTSFAFPIEIPAQGERLVLLQLRSTSSIQVPMKLWQENAFYEERQYTDGAQFFYYGAMMIMVAYNFFIFLSVRQATYLYYCCFVISYILFQLSLKGVGFHYVWPNWPHIVDRLIPMSAAIAQIFAGIFTYKFLRLESRRSWLSRMLVYCVYANILGFVVAPFVSYNSSIKIIATLCIANAAIAFSTGIEALINGQKEARYYVTAWAALLLGIIAYLLRVFGIIPSNLVTENAPQVGSVLETVLLSFSLGDRLNTLKSNLAASNKALSDHLRNVEAIVDQKTRSIRSILDTLQQGIVTVQGPELAVQNEYAKYTETLLDTNDIAGHNLIEILFTSTDLSVDDRARIMECLRASLGEDSLNFEMNHANLPLSCELQIQGRERRALELDWTPILNAQNEVERILLSFRDVTEIRRLRAESDEHMKEMHMLSELLQVEASKLRRFFQGARHALDEDQRLCVPGAAFDPELIKILFINMHTIKGEARGLGLGRLAEAAHILEEDYTRMRHHPEDWSASEMGRKIADIMELIGQYEHLFTDKLHQAAMDDQLAISREQLTHWQNTVKHWTLAGAEAAQKQELLKVWSRTLYVDLKVHLSHYKDMMDRVARDLQKPEPRLVLNGPEVFLDQSAVPLLDKVLIHLLRNALDHGLESEEERVQLGKEPVGTVEMSWEFQNHMLYLRLQDDGRGLNLSRIRSKSQQLGLKPASSNPRDLAQLIFESGLSTATTVTNISGRGVGLSAVRHFLQEAGGDIDLEIQTQGEDWIAFNFRLALPLRYIRDVGASVWKKSG